MIIATNEVARCWTLQKFECKCHAGLVKMVENLLPTLFEKRRVKYSCEIDIFLTNADKTYWAVSLRRVFQLVKIQAKLKIGSEM